jgi:Cys-tRNA synthase (O-phospho-L-seryl-tRNA:Cys-tRNA synthase)
VYPGEVGYLSQLLKTGSKKVIAGVACEEYVANNLRHHAKVVNTNHAKVTAHVWIPMDPHSLFPGYSVIPDHYKTQIETMRIQGSYPPVVMPLEMFLEYGNGDKVFTYTTEIIFGEGRRVFLTDIIK